MATDFNEYHFLGDHLREEHNMKGAFAHLVPWSAKDRVLQHDLDHDNPIGLGHIHPNPDDVRELEET